MRIPSRLFFVALLGILGVVVIVSMSSGISVARAAAPIMTATLEVHFSEPRVVTNANVVYITGKIVLKCRDVLSDRESGKVIQPGQPIRNRNNDDPHFSWQMQPQNFVPVNPQDDPTNPNRLCQSDNPDMGWVSNTSRVNPGIFDVLVTDKNSTIVAQSSPIVVPPMSPVPSSQMAITLDKSVVTSGQAVIATVTIPHPGSPPLGSEDKPRIVAWSHSTPGSALPGEDTVLKNLDFVVANGVATALYEIPVVSLNEGDPETLFFLEAVSGTGAAMHSISNIAQVTVRPAPGYCQPLLSSNRSSAGKTKVLVVPYYPDTSAFPNDFIQGARTVVNQFLSYVPYSDMVTDNKTGARGKFSDKFYFYYSDNQSAGGLQFRCNAERERGGETFVACMKARFNAFRKLCGRTMMPKYIIVLDSFFYMQKYPLQSGYETPSVPMVIVRMDSNTNQALRADGAIVAHEFGHFIANLNEEYVTADSGATGINCLVPGAPVWWRNLVGQGEGDFKVAEDPIRGCHYANYFRATKTSIMNTINNLDLLTPQAYGPVNQYLLRKKLSEDFHVTFDTKVAN